MTEETNTQDTNTEEFKNNRDGKYSHIKGWGIDADPDNDPTYPIKKRTDEEIKGYSWERPEQQESDIEVLHSIERPNITAVFGTAAPPSGLSGKLRRYAFTQGESSYARWLPLVLADRVGVVEAIAEDIKNGHFPNILAEKGIKSEWKYNRKEFILKTMTKVIVTGVVITLLTRKRK